MALCGTRSTWRRVGLVIDLDENVVFSNFKQHIELVERDGLPAVRLLPLAEDDRVGTQFAMMAENLEVQNLEEEHPDEGLPDDDEVDFWQQEGDAWVRVHVRPRKLLYSPDLEPSPESDVEEQVSREHAFRKRVVIHAESGEKVEFRDRWQDQGSTNRDVSELAGGKWKGYSYFYKDTEYVPRGGVGNSETAASEREAVTGFAAFDEERPNVLTKGQRKLVQEGSDHLRRQDAAMWSELKNTRGPSRSSRLLPRGCGTFLLEIFAGAATLTALAVSSGMAVSQPIDLELDGGKLLDAAIRKQVTEQIEWDDLYLVAIAPVCAPWSSWQSLNLSRGGKTELKIIEERRRWYPVVEWVPGLVSSRTARGREVVLENPWGSLLWQLRCVEKLYGRVNTNTEQVLEVVYLDQCMYGLKDVVTGLHHRKGTGLLTRSKRIKDKMSKTCSGQH